MNLVLIAMLTKGKTERETTMVEITHKVRVKRIQVMTFNVIGS